jgi:hypothetical protein
MTSTFTCFSNLPAELRIKIWEKVIVSRTIRVNFERMPYYQKATYRRSTGRKSTTATVKFHTNCTAPAGGSYGTLGTFSASSESRAESLRLAPDFIQLGMGQVIHFNAKHDAIFLDLYSLFWVYEYVFDARLGSAYKLRGMESVQNLAVVTAGQGSRGLRSVRGGQRLYHIESLVGVTRVTVNNWILGSMQSINALRTAVQNEYATLLESRRFTHVQKRLLIGKHSAVNLYVNWFAAQVP